ncbi:DDE superfamily endonuclease domain-containing protein [Phthorimaea operculella]|nr:DDE superfamily endonuclease domain-containing protein [Phthorimaea operculella]
MDVEDIVCGYGKNSDGGIFEESMLGRKLADGTLNIPNSRPLQGQNERTSCVLIGDQALALSSYMMRPYPEAQARYDRRKEKFNTNLGRARRVVENAFGILSAKWYIFHRPMETKVTTSITVVNAACVLHNFLIERNSEHVNYPVEEQREHEFEDLLPNSRRSSNYAFLIRERFADYFNTDA